MNNKVLGNWYAQPLKSNKYRCGKGRKRYQTRLLSLKLPKN